MRWFPVRVLVGVCGARATAARGTVEVSPSVGGVGGVGGWGWGMTGCCAVCGGEVGRVPKYDAEQMVSRRRSAPVCHVSLRASRFLLTVSHVSLHTAHRHDVNSDRHPPGPYRRRPRCPPPRPHPHRHPHLHAMPGGGGTLGRPAENTEI